MNLNSIAMKKGCEMLRSSLFVFLSCIMIVSSADAGKRSKRYSVDFGSVKITWFDFLSKGSVFAKSFPQKKGESLYMFVAQPAKNNTISFKKFVAFSEQAVAAEGKCTWLGYDRALDLRFRATGGLASSKDERLFFTRLKCKRR